MAEAIGARPKRRAAPAQQQQERVPPPSVRSVIRRAPNSLCVELIEKDDEKRLKNIEVWLRGRFSDRLCTADGVTAAAQWTNGIKDELIRHALSDRAYLQQQVDYYDDSIQGIVGKLEEALDVCRGE